MTPTFCRGVNLLLALGLVLSPCWMWADDKPAQRINGWQRLFRKQAAEYKFVAEGDEGGEVKLVAEPLLQWNQPVRGGSDGAVFVWTKEGRPVAIGTLFIWPMDNGLQAVTHELHSLSQAPLVATRGSLRWTPPQDSIVWKSIPDSPVPAGTADQRLRQMRDLARQFTTESHDRSDRRWELRTLARPIYRYALDRKDGSTLADREVLDGALFGLVEGTDLEIVLSIEARKTTAGYRWEFAMSRMSDYRLTAKLADKTVWEVEPSTTHGDPKMAYHCLIAESRASADDVE